MAAFGKVEAFDPNVESWSRYAERLEFYFEANDIGEDKLKRAIFLTACGSTVYGLVTDLIAPKKASEEARPHLTGVQTKGERGKQGPQSGKRRGNWAHRVAELSPTPPEEYEDEEEEIAVVLVVRDKPPSPMVVEVDLNGCKVSFEVDTGASRSVIGEATYKRIHGHDSAVKLMPSSTVLRSYTGQNIKECGSVHVMADYNGQEALLNLLVVSGRGTNLLGRDWIKVLNLDWSGLLDNLNKVEIELERLQLAGIIQPVSNSEWAAPVVPVLKGDGTIRLCGDYKLTANVASRVEQYPLPRIDELFAKLSGGVIFTKLDMSHAYQQLVLDPESWPVVTINTHKGLFQYTRLPFGVSSACAIFQRAMEGLLAGIDYVAIYLDDLLITGSNHQQHLETLQAVLTRLEEAGLRLKRSKCVFMAPQVEYLGHKVTAEGLQPLENKVQAIKDASEPQNIGELRAYLGLLKYYGKFLPRLATVLAPLHVLLKTGVPWMWGTSQRAAFQRSKDLLSSTALLVHYDPALPLVIAADASPYGLGAVLSHRMPDNTDRPICFASRSLAPAERKYAQVEKEGLAVTYAVKKFHQFVYGRSFTVQTDRKPLLGLLGELKNIQPTASARLQRWALLLMHYQYNLVYKPGPTIAHADGLSRLPLPQTATSPSIPPELISLLQQQETAPITSQQLMLWTRRDPLLSRVCRFVGEGWPVSCPSEDLLPFFKKRDELTVESGVLLWGMRVVVPPPGRETLLEELHDTHPGITRMKATAQAYMWWPGLDTALEDRVKSCLTCQQLRNAPPAAPICPWEWPGKPWTCIHIDYAGPFQGGMFLLAVDSHSKWLEVFPVKAATSTATIEHLRSAFSIHGLPHSVVSDNATVFTSSEFTAFLERNGVRHITSAPYKPSTNGLVERAVQTLKQALRKTTGGSLKTCLARFLATYRFSPHTTTGVSPAEMMFGRRVRTRWDLLRPDVHAKVLHKQEKMLEGSNSSHSLRDLPPKSGSVGQRFFRESQVATRSGAGEDWTYVLSSGGRWETMASPCGSPACQAGIDQRQPSQTPDNYSAGLSLDWDFPEDSPRNRWGRSTMKNRPF
ncbi:hypothetical protein SKAU_G00280800 [Synaphobranchus kaupii]|uniref:Gypsy retrotransposon integrase-like protein 1 n=1 Tax=Synaphobranchus kaupii TaxID=118154 RepID=A0A9Q1EX92_SYNKA|nr:hypothetical protein SKAU_G00280800 [Synaphobranchus kaupii]